MGYDMEMEDYHEDKEALEKELEQLKKEIMEEAKKVVDNYVENPSDISGSVVNIHENSPFLDSDEDGEPVFSGSRWTKVIRTKP
tara:strand:+ start:195 stop:446 length:252 start_codon:yes stop_codon:yes gene_type:complete